MNNRPEQKFMRLITNVCEIKIHVSPGHFHWTSNFICVRYNNSVPLSIAISFAFLNKKRHIENKYLIFLNEQVLKISRNQQS